jgi:hypothetical protein
MGLPFAKASRSEAVVVALCERSKVALSPSYGIALMQQPFEQN